VVLLDEFEKAHPALQDAFLQLFDEGVFINGAGETISCRSMVLIATTNAGAEATRGPAVGFDLDASLDARRRAVDQALKERFRIELLNRFDRVVHFARSAAPRSAPSRCASSRL